MGPKKSKVLSHAAEANMTTIGETSHVTRLSFNEARAMLKALERDGYVYERLGHEGYDNDRPVPIGLYVMTPWGMSRTGTHRPVGGDSWDRELAEALRDGAERPE